MTIVSRPTAQVLEIAGRKLGGEHFALIAGPCTIETRAQTLDTARAVWDAGATMFRGGAYKPRTSPYAFQGLGQEGLRLLAEAKAQTGLPIVTECMDLRDLDDVLEVADVVQIGARNMQNYGLLTEVGRAGRPVLIKRGLSSTIEELLQAAEYVLKEGNEAVILCERGIRTFETAYRFTLDLAAVPVLKARTHLPVIVDPSHAAGRRELVAVEQPPTLEPGHGRVPVVVAPPPGSLLRRPTDGARGGRHHVDLTAVEARFHQRGHVPVTPMLPHHGACQPQPHMRGERPGWRHRRPRRGQGATFDRAEGRGFGPELGGLRHAGPVDRIAEETAKDGVHRLQPGGEDVVGPGESPCVGKRSAHHGGGEVEERGNDRLRADGTHGRGPSGEVAHPESAQPQGGVGLGDLGGEVHDGVQRLEHRPPPPHRSGVHGQPCCHGRR
jgi:3-deoxy-7-phosphoheptulonate synthase